MGVQYTGMDLLGIVRLCALAGWHFLNAARARNLPSPHRAAAPAPRGVDAWDRRRRLAVSRDILIRNQTPCRELQAITARLLASIGDENARSRSRPMCKQGSS